MRCVQVRNADIAEMRLYIPVGMMVQHMQTATHGKLDLTIHSSNLIRSR